PPAFDLGTIRRFFEYSDAMQRHVMAAAASRPDAQLDQRFDMGLGTIRQTLLHIRFAEQWWLQNWTVGPENFFPESPPETSIPELQRLFDETVAGRNQFIAGLSEADLMRPIEARPRAGVSRTFPLGVTMLQMCHHGLHHRAQAVNMIRRVGGAPLEMDFMLRARQPA